MYVRTAQKNAHNANPDVVRFGIFTGINKTLWHPNKMTKMLLIIGVLVIMSKITAASHDHHDDHPLDNLSWPKRIAEHTYKHPNFSPDTIPVQNHTRQIRVWMGMALRQIVEVNEFHQLIKITVWVRQYWRDEFIRWNPANFSGVRSIFVKPSDIWKPDMVLYSNGAKDYDSMSADIPIQVSYKGDVTYIYPAMYTVACSMNIMYFPFDEQSCKIEFGSWSYTIKILDLQMKLHNAADAINYQHNTAWRLRSLSVRRKLQFYGCCPDDPFPTVEFLVTIRRYWVIHFFYMLIPILLIQMLAVMQFLLPCDSGEKVSLGVTIYLSMVVYLLMVAEMLPSTEDIPLVVKFIIATLVVVAAAQSVTIIVLLIHHNGTHDNHGMLPYWARLLFLHWLAHLMGMARYITSDIDHVIKLTPYHSEIVMPGINAGNGSKKLSCQKCLRSKQKPCDECIAKTKRDIKLATHTMDSSEEENEIGEYTPSLRSQVYGSEHVSKSIPQKKEERRHTSPAALATTPKIQIEDTKEPEMGVHNILSSRFKPHKGKVGSRISKEPLKEDVEHCICFDRVQQLDGSSVASTESLSSRVSSRGFLSKESSGSNEETGEQAIPNFRSKELLVQKPSRPAGSSSKEGRLRKISSIDGSIKKDFVSTDPSVVHEVSRHITDTSELPNAGRQDITLSLSEQGRVDDHKEESTGENIALNSEAMTGMKQGVNDPKSDKMFDSKSKTPQVLSKDSSHVDFVDVENLTNCNSNKGVTEQKSDNLATGKYVTNMSSAQSHVDVTDQYQCDGVSVQSQSVPVQCGCSGMKHRNIVQHSSPKRKVCTKCRMQARQYANCLSCHGRIEDGESESSLISSKCSYHTGEHAVNEFHERSLEESNLGSFKDDNSSDFCRHCKTKCKPTFEVISETESNKCGCIRAKNKNHSNNDTCLLSCCQCMDSELQKTVDAGEQVCTTKPGAHNTNTNNIVRSRLNRLSIDATNILEERSSMIIKGDSMDGNREKLLFKILKRLEEYKTRLHDDDKDAEVKCEWQQVAMVLDRFMFFVFLLITTLLWIVSYSFVPIYDDVGEQ